MEEFRNVLASALADELDTIPVEELVYGADSVIGSAPMKALRAMILDMAFDMSCYVNEFTYTPEESTSTSDQVRLFARYSDVPQYLVDWLLEEEK